MNKKILLLWSPLADYSLACFEQLSKKDNLSLHIICQKNSINAPFASLNLSFFENAFIYEKTDKKKLLDFCIKLEPDLIIMCSWNYAFYMKISRQCKKLGTKIVSAFDGQWRGSLKQYLGILSSPLFLKPVIDNFFVPGDRQATFARKLGYPNPFQGYYCANDERFIYKKVSKIKNFIFIGRLVQVKGIEYLIDAYLEYRKLVKEPWDLIICGKGELIEKCKNHAGVKILGFSQPELLPQILLKSTCLILPSFFEPWGLVVHEAALAGLAIICSHKVGASTYFLRDGQNGFIINPDKHSLVRALIEISQKSDIEFEEMSTISIALGSLWTKNKWANYVYSQILQ